jgi:diadenosine tetraphosphate (Ap4A) HIT family hydrolase
LKWIGLASLSGIVGAASWDLVKAAIKKIREQLDSSDSHRVSFLSTVTSNHIHLLPSNDKDCQGNGLYIGHKSVIRSIYAQILS